MPSLLGEDPENQICYQLLLIFSTIERDKRIKSAASLVFFLLKMYLELELFLHSTGSYVGLSLDRIFFPREKNNPDTVFSAPANSDLGRERAWCGNICWSPIYPFLATS